MSSKVSSKKGKKPLDLPLGKAPIVKDAEVDLSHVRLPIETSIFGLNQALALFQTATSEVKRYLAYECELMYECRKCRTIFRSLANFILHKRKYCRDKYDDSSTQGHKGDQACFLQKDIEAANRIIDNENTNDNNLPKRLLNPIIEKLLKKQEHAKFIQDVKNENLRESKDEEEPKTLEVLDNMVLEKIDTSNVAVFQTATTPQERNLGETEFMKDEVMEIHSIFEENEAAVGSDGKIISLNGEKKLKKKSLCCTECDLKFSTKKTLIYHVKYKHNNSRLVYPCPECKEVLSSAWCVYRHLLKVHRKTTSQIRKYRNQIHNGAVCRKTEETPKIRKEVKEKDAKEENDEENEWLDNFEGDNDFQMCGGCGKRFERKAALTSHSVMCTKRIAICNTIKENQTKKKENDDKEIKLRHKINKLNNKRPVGSSKRKPENLITYKSKTEAEENSKDEPDKDDGEIENHDASDEVANCSESEKENVTPINEENQEEEEEFSARCETPPCRGFVDDDVSNLRISPLRKLMKNLCESEIKQNVEIKVIQISDDEENDEIEAIKTGEDEEMEAIETGEDVEIEAIKTGEDEENEEIEAIKTGEDKVNEEMKAIKTCGNEENKEIKAINSCEDKENEEIKLSETCEELEEDNGITLNNNNKNENFDLVLCYNESEDLSFQSLVKNMIENDIREEILNDPQIEEEKNEEYTLITIVDDNTPKEIKNEDTEITEQDSNVERKPKRKRSESSDEINIKKFIHSNESSENENEDEVFTTRVAAYTNMQTLSCSLCNTKFNSLSHLLLHMSIHFSWYRYQCSKCPFMSYNQYDCESHVHKEHQLPFTKMQNMVLPIPTWKTVLISNNFINLEPINPEVPPLNDKDDKNLIVGIIDLTSEDDENSNSQDEVIQEVLDDQNMSKQAILEVILGNEMKNDIKDVVCNEYTRPPRNRVKSIKTSQKDFIYDMDVVRNKTVKGNSSLISKISEITDDN